MKSDGATEACTDGLEPWLTDMLIPAASLPPWDGFSATCSPIPDQSLGTILLPWQSLDVGKERVDVRAQ